MSTRLAGGNESISSYGDGTRDYTALATHEGATDNNNVSDEVSPVLEIYDDASPYDDFLFAAGAINNATYRRIWRAASGHRHLGDPASGVRFTRTSNGHGFLTNLEEYVQFEDLVITVTVNDAATVYTVYVLAANCRVVGIICFDSTNATGNAFGFETHAAGTGCFFYNCAAIGNQGEGVELRSTGCRVWNCTLISNGAGMDTVGAISADVRNTISQNTTTDFDTTSYAAACTNNWSSDGSAPGSNAKSGTITYEDSGNDIYRLGSADTGAKDQGSDISSDVDDDVAFNTRAQGAAVDIGFHEFTAAGGGIIHKRSFPRPLLGM